MKKLTSVPNLNILSQKLANPPLNLPLHFLIGIPFLRGGATVIPGGTFIPESRVPICLLGLSDLVIFHTKNKLWENSSHSCFYQTKILTIASTF